VTLFLIKARVRLPQCILPLNRALSQPHRKQARFPHFIPIQNAALAKTQGDTGV
jgi:hypothetical protein